jgi:GNAT superfamily N-acetyltransferase
MSRFHINPAIFSTAFSTVLRRSLKAPDHADARERSAIWSRIVRRSRQFMSFFELFQKCFATSRRFGLTLSAYAPCSGPNGSEQFTMRSIHGLATVRRCPEAHAGAIRLPVSDASGRARVTIVQLGPEHDAQLCALLLGLEQPARVSRFGHAVSDTGLEAYARHALTTAVLVAGVFHAGSLVGVVEMFAGGDAVIGELAFAIDVNWRRRGLATALLESAKGWAGYRDLHVLRMVIARGNWPMRALAAKVGARLDLGCDELQADVDVPRVSASPASRRIDVRGPNL